MMDSSESNFSTIAQYARSGIYALFLFVTLFIQQFSNNLISLELAVPMLGISFVGFLFQLTHLVWPVSRELKLVSFLIDAILIQIFIFYSFQLSSLMILFHLINIFLAAVSLGSMSSLVVALFSAIIFGASLMLSQNASSSQLLLSYSLNLFTFVMVGGIAGYLSELLKQTQGALFDLKEIQRRVYEVSPVGILVSKIIDQDQIEVVNHNQAVSKIFAFDESKSDQQLFSHSFFSDLSLNRKQSFFSKEVQVAEEKKSLLIQQTQFSLSDQLRFLVTAISDQTDLKKLEWDLKQKEKLAAIGGLAAGIAHEIRNPLASISGSVELLSQNAQSADDQKLMKIILKEISRLNMLITEFLDYAKPEPQPSALVDIRNVITECLSSLRMSKDLLSILKTDLKIEENLPSFFIHGDQQKLRQALLNFLINAVQAMKDSPQPLLQVSLKESVVNETSWVQLEIQDSGQGMSEEIIKKIFEPFFTTKPKGTGLGLAMTHKILVSHQAKIEVESKLGQGSIFRLKFPLVYQQ
jgi:two-component system sensor histidine kinase PilS (NtrC family)